MSKNYTPKLHESVMAEKLRKLLPGAGKRGSGRPRNDARSPMPSPMEAGADGTDHINIWDKGATDLGKLLAHSTRLSFTHDIFGRFSNVEAFWHYIRSEERDDRIRAMTGKDLKVFSEKLTNSRVPNFRAIIMDANWQKVQQYPDLLESIKASTLPFECYYVYKREDGVRIRPTFAFWVLSGFNEIRNALQEGREPDFESLKDNKNIGIYDAVLKPKKAAAPKGKKQAKTDKSQDTTQAVVEPVSSCALVTQIVNEVTEAQAPLVTGEPEAITGFTADDQAEMSTLLVSACNTEAEPVQHVSV